MTVRNQANDKGTWYATTPGLVTVRRSFNDLTVNCAVDGQPPGIAIVKSATKGMAFGNILFGGVIGAGVDMSTGAAYDYPELIIVSMGQTITQLGKPGAPATAATGTQGPSLAGAGAAGPLNSASPGCNPVNPTCRP